MKKTPTAYLRIISIAVLLAAFHSPATAEAPDGTLLSRITGADLTAMPSPETSAPLRHIENSIDYSTGKATVAIPLHVYSTPLLSVPITLRGQTGAVKVDEESGNIGKGWELDCGGFVARSIVGMPDTTSITEVRDLASEADTLYLMNLMRYNKDSHYDRYTYMAGGYSGSFMCARGQIVRLTDDDCSIEFLPGGPSEGFLITVPDGTRYRYDVPELQSHQVTTLTYSGITGLPGYEDVPCMWRLGSITDRTGTDKVTFTYGEASVCRRWTGGKVYTETIKTDFNGASTFISASEKSSETSHLYRYYQRHILREISGRAGKVVFSTKTVYADNPIDYFTGFSVMSNTGEKVREVSFSHIARGSSDFNRDILLKGYRVTAGDSLIDAAEFSYYYEDNVSSRKDFYGFCNQGASDFRIYFKGPGIDGLLLNPGITRPRERFTEIEGDYVGSGYKREYEAVYVAPHEGVINVRNDTVMTNPFRRPHPVGVLYGALRTIEHASGTVTEFSYEPAAVPGAINGTDTATIGLRLVKETVTDQNTGSVRERSLSYDNAMSSFDLSYLGYSNFISVSGMTDVESMGGTFYAEYGTTGLTLTNCSRSPGASPENAVAYHGKVTETVTGTGLDSPVVTVYEYDLSGMRVERGSGGSAPSVRRVSDVLKYAGSELARGDEWKTDRKVHRELYGMHTFATYEKEIIGPRAPLRRVTEYVCENGKTRPLRVTETSTSFVDREVTVGYYCQLLRRNIKKPVICVYPTDVTMNDFCHFPVKAVARRAYTDTVRVTEYDASGNSRTVTSVHTYNNHGASVAGNGLPYRTVTTCGGDTHTTTLTYVSTRGSGYEACTDAISLPVSETVTSGYSTTERRTIYSFIRMGETSPSGLFPTLFLPSGLVTRHNGVTRDSIAITAYDAYCNPTGAVQNGDAPVTFGWGYSGTLPVSVTAGGLTTRYEHSPLVGCTAVLSPGGTRRSFAYRGGRLWKESVAGTDVAEHTYRVYATDGINSVTTRSLTGTGAGPCATVRSDAFGNPVATCVSPSASPGTGIVTLATYDALSRPLRQYMPFGGSLSGLTEELEQEALQAYGGDAAPFTSSVHEAAPSGRTLSVTLGGAEFAGYPVRTQYRFNTSGGELSCRRYRTTLPGGGLLKCEGLWPEGTLAVTVSSDHDGRAVYVFTDFTGRKVMERRSTGGTPAWADTHYVYDDAGSLVYVLTPAASAALTSAGSWNPFTEPALKEHAYVYSYDARMRMIFSRAPGVEETRVWHDSTGAQVFSQDPLQKRRGVMSFSLADNAGRPAVSGECSYSEATVSQASSLRLRAAVSATWTDAMAGYTLDAMPLPGAVAHTAVYYDGYGFLKLSAFALLNTFVSSKGYLSPRTDCTGLATGSWSRLTGAEGAVLSLSHLDSRERTVRTVTSAMPSGFLVTDTEYSNTDRPLSETVTHYPDGGTPRVLRVDRTYDGYDRQSGMTVRLDGKAMTSTADTYSSAGRRTKSTFGNPSTRAVTYTYTTRGDIASITAPDFTQTLTYSADSCRNGNIRTSSWKGRDGIQRAYRFSYDGMNRLTRAAYTESGRGSLPARMRLEGTPDYTESTAYDLSSNPVRIRRHGITDAAPQPLSDRGYLRFGLCDDITLTYSGQRLVRADDSAPGCDFSGATDFLDGASSPAEYTYDASGNLLSDANRGIGSVTYNRLHRPQSIVKGDYLFGFVYDAAGNLVRRTQNHPTVTSVMPYSVGAEIMGPVYPFEPNPWVTDTISYCGPFEYRNSELSRVSFPGGYISGDTAYHYIQDHQGNVRQVVNAVTGSVLQENHYYPGGMLFAETTYSYFRNGSAKNAYRYGGKEFLTHGGLHLSLHGARMYDPALGRFITPDPLCHQTPHLSTYLYCAANPVMCIDPTGLTLFYCGTAQQMEALKAMVEELKKNKLFKLYFDEIDNSPDNYYIRFGSSGNEEYAWNGYYNSSSKTITIREGGSDYRNFTAVIEETFHVYQEIMNGSWSKLCSKQGVPYLRNIYKFTNNIEYEAKIVTQLIVNDINNENFFEGLYDLPPGFSFEEGSFIKRCLHGDTSTPYISFLDIRYIGFEELSKLYIANGKEFVKGQPNTQPLEYRVNRIVFSSQLYDLLLRASPE